MPRSPTPLRVFEVIFTGGPHYMRSIYLQFCVYAIQKWPLFWNISSNLESSLVFLYENLLCASLFLKSLSLAPVLEFVYNTLPCHTTCFGILINVSLRLILFVRITIDSITYLYNIIFLFEVLAIPLLFATGCRSS